MAQTNPLWDLIQAHMDDPKHPIPPKPADLSRQSKVSDQVISKWKAKPVLPSAEQLFKFASGTGMDYLELLKAALTGRGYLPIDSQVEIRMRVPLGGLVFNRPDEEGSDRNADSSAANKTPETGPAKQPVLREVSEFEADWAAREDPPSKDKGPDDPA